MRVGDFVPDVESALKIEAYKEQYKNKILLEITKKKIDQKLTNINVIGRE